MLTHSQIWNAIDRLAARNNLTPSGLAKKAGLDPTTFNKSKRITVEGRARWPSTESVAKALAATSTKVDTFVSLITDGKPPVFTLPLVRLAEAGGAGLFDNDGWPTGKNWDEFVFPSMNDEHAFVLEVSGDTLKPLYRDGDTIVVSPMTPARRGDRVVLKVKSGEVMVRELKRKTAKSIELKSVTGEHRGDRTLATSDVVWMARIIWVSQ